MLWYPICKANRYYWEALEVLIKVGDDSKGNKFALLYVSSLSLKNQLFYFFLGLFSLVFLPSLVYCFLFLASVYLYLKYHIYMEKSVSPQATATSFQGMKGEKSIRSTWSPHEKIVFSAVGMGSDRAWAAALWSGTQAHCCSPMRILYPGWCWWSEHRGVVQSHPARVSIVCLTASLPMARREARFWTYQEAPWLLWCPVVLCHLLMWFLSCWPAS